MKKPDEKPGKNTGKRPEKKPEAKKPGIPELKAHEIEPKRPDLICPEDFKKFSPKLQVQLNELMEHEKIITSKLRDPKEKELFICDPKAFFAKHKIKVSPFIERKMKAFKLEEMLPVEDFIMPNGQRIVPKVKINIK
ncbi:MAG: hypothetical protein R6U46_04350 [Marinilabilia sp.]